MTLDLRFVARSHFLLGYAVIGSMVAWAAHLLYTASAVEFVCTHPEWRWTLHAATAVTALATVVAIAMAVGLVQAGNDDESAGTRRGQLRFLGYVSLLVGAIDLALILLEGSFVIFIGPCD